MFEALVALILTIAIGVGFVEGFFYIARGVSKESYGDSLKALRGSGGITCFNRWGADLTIRGNYSDLPKIELSYSTFVTLLSADPSKISICLLNADDNLPGAIFYDKNNDGCANVRIVMRTRKDARTLIKWFHALRRAEEREAQERKNMAEYEEIVSVTEAMQKDLKAQRDRQHVGLMKKAMENQKWREAAENRQMQIRGG